MIASTVDVHPCIKKAIGLAVRAHRRRLLAQSIADETTRFVFEVQAEALSENARRALANFTPPH